MTNFSRACAFSAIGCVFALAACGDDTPDPTGGTTTTTTSTTTTTGEGGQGGSTTSTGGGGSGPTAALGEPCTTDEGCEDGFCLKEDETGWGMGYCTALCNDLVPCGAGTTCVDIGVGQFCLSDCMPGSAGCLAHQECIEIDTDVGVCGPGCKSNTDCPALGQCNENGLCTEPENCSDGTDNDGDGLVDCEDDGCATDCATDITNTCGGATTAQATQTGDTTGSTALFAGSCTGAQGALEDVYSYATPGAGYLHVTLASDTDQGIYVRSDCADGQTELACVDAVVGGTDEELFLNVGGAQTLTIFVDGYESPDEAGPYTLDVEFLTPENETEDNGSSGSANAISGGLAAAAIGSTGDEDWFAVTVPGGNLTLSATVIDGATDTCAPAGNIDTELEIFDTDGTTSLAFNDDIDGFGNYCSGAEAQDLPAGTYFVRVAASQQFCAMCTFDYGVLFAVE